MKHLNLNRSYFYKTGLLILMLMQVFASYAQSVVKGYVRDSGGAAIPGATVRVQETNQTDQTDANGFFQISTERFPVTLEVTSVGYEPLLRLVREASELSFEMSPSSNKLDEVVVVAYGTQTRRNVVGSVSQISSDDIKKAPSMNITNTLAGRVPGLTSLQQSGRPGADNATIYLRGIGTYGSNRTPLVIVDDVERPMSTLAYLDPNEIESISFLKDAVSTAVYGLQAANGIILVKTKTGRKEQAKVSYDFGYSIGQNTRFPEFLNGPDYMSWYNKGIEIDNDFLVNTNQPETNFVYTQEMIDAVRNGTNTNPLLGDTDWVGLLTKNNSYSQHHSATVSGGANKTQYFAAVSHMDQDGVIDNTDFKRYNVRTNLKSELNDYLSVGLNVGLRHQLTNTPGISPDNTSWMNPFYQAVRMLPNLPMYAPNGLPVAHQAGAGWVNPISSVENSGYQKYKANFFQGQANVDLKVPYITGLTARVQGAYDFNNQESKTWTSPYETMGRSRDQVSGDFVHMSTLPGINKTTLRQGYSASYRTTLQSSLNYATRFANDHSLNVLALYEYSRTNGNRFGTGASNFPITIIHEIGYGSTAPEDVIAATGASDAETARAGFVTRLNYAYKDRYLVELVSRWDASANFAIQNRWEAFPAVGLGWIVSDEDFFQPLTSKFDFLKLKGSIGKTGNDRAQVGTFPYLSTFSQNSTPVVVIDGQPVKAIYTNALQNPDLRWETSTISNIGIETRFLNGKFGFDFEWFYKYTEGILGSVSNLYPASIGGYYPALANIGTFDNRGFDAQLRYNDTFGDFKLGVVGNINWARNRYLKLDEASGIAVGRSLIGKSVGTKIGYEVEGMIQTWEEARNTPSPSSGFIAPGFFKFKDQNGDGRINVDDMTYIGRANVPELTFGLNINMAYKGFDLSALLQGAALADVTLGGTYEGSGGAEGIDDNSPFTRTFYNYGNSPYFLVENSWRPDNPNAEFPRITSYKGTQMSAHNANRNSGWVRKGDYLRLKSVQLGYTIPKSATQQIKIEDVRLFVSGSNLFTWDHLKYLDPEMPNVNNGFYPQQRIFEFGLSVTF